MALVTFKSEKKYFDVEKTDVKNNTIRVIDANDSRFTLIKQYYNHFLRKLDIDILCVETQEKFRRHIRNVSYFQDLVILTWDAKEGVNGDM